MTLEQAYYTSSRTGRGPGAGFQVTGASVGLSQSQLYEIERLGQYSPPASAPDRPTDCELASEELFPISLYYHCSTPNQAWVGQARYTGKDYSNRYGNFFAHTLVSADAVRDFSTIHPVELWRGSFWQTRENPLPNPVLPCLELKDIRSSVTLRSIREFVSGAGRADRLAYFLTALEFALTNRRRILVVPDHGDAVAAWIAAAVFSLPHKLALSVTFTTYVKDPYSTGALVTGITEHPSTFGFSDMEMRGGQFSVFDFRQNRFSPLSVSPFGEHAAALFLSSDDAAMLEFHHFARSAGSMAELIPALDWFLFRKGKGPQRIDAAGMLAGAARDAEESPGELEAMLREVVEQAKPTAEIYPAWRHLHAAFPPGEKRLIVEDALLSWIELQFAEIEPSSFGGLMFSTAGRNRARAREEKWVRYVQTVRTLHGLADWICLGLETGTIANAESLEDLGAGKLGPMLADAGVAACVLRLTSIAAALPLFDGIARYCESQAEDGEVLSRIADFLAIPRVSELLEEYAGRTGAFRLLIRIHATRAQAGGSRIVRFRRIVEAVEGADRATADTISFAYRCLWPVAAPPEMVDAAGILEVLEASAVPLPEVTEELAAILRRNMNFLKLDRALEEGARLLLERTEAQLSSHTPILLAYSRMGSITTNTASPSTYFEMLPVAEQLSGKQRQQFVLALFCGFLSIPEGMQHISILREAVARRDGRFFAYYHWAAIEVASLVSNRSPWLAGLVKVWAAEARSFPQELEQFERRLLPALAARLSGREQKQVSRLLETYAAASAIWQSREPVAPAEPEFRGNWFRVPWRGSSRS